MLGESVGKNSAGTAKACPDCDYIDDLVMDDCSVSSECSRSSFKGNIPKSLGIRRKKRVKLDCENIKKHVVKNFYEDCVMQTASSLPP